MWMWMCVDVGAQLMKSITYQFVLGKEAYLRSGWNIMDFIIVVTSILDMTLGDVPLLPFLQIVH